MLRARVRPLLACILRVRQLPLRGKARRAAQRDERSWALEELHVRADLADGSQGDGGRRRPAYFRYNIEAIVMSARAARDGAHGSLESVEGVAR
ncbi:hypothetical protein FGB62_342g08 [Gracilaria domingensis]|nr:hypothetical protein FGB62_342g08 [Gracilaria domingensis]